jgi:hypothetical protein
MFWFDKENPNVVFGDIRDENLTMCNGKELKINPDMVLDFTNLPFDNDSFYHVVFDPPHLNKLSGNTWMAQKYGKLLPTWEDDIRGGFEECMRVLKTNGTLIFKWNEIQIKLNQVLKILPQQPLYGHTSGKHGRTIWLCFMKLKNN